MTTLTVKAALQIQKPIDVVFVGIVNPKHMIQYFISESTGRLEEGKELIWKWPEFPDHKSIVNNIKIEKNKLISFVWDDDTTVTMLLEEQPDKSVVVRVTEGEKVLNDANIKWYGNNTEGWANFLAFLKAYLEYGISMRKGAFDFMRKP